MASTLVLAPRMSGLRLGRRQVYAGLTLLLALSMLMSLTLGYRIYSLDQVWMALFAHDGSETAVVIAGLRLPRALIAPLCGAALGMAGGMVQTL